MNILITGAAGYIGSALTKELAKTGDTIYTLDVKQPLKEYAAGTHHIMQDMTNLEALQEKLKPINVDVAIHLAALVSGNPSDVLRINVDGTANLLETLRLKKPKLVVIASTAAQLYRNAQYVPIDEKHPITPVTTYGLSKHLTEEVARFYYRVYALPTLIFRQTNVFGPAPVPKDTVINKFVEDALSKGRVTIYGDGKQVRNFIYIDDLVECYLKAIHHKKQETLAGEALNIAGPEEHQIQELAQIVAKIVGGKIEKQVTVEYAPPSIPPAHEVYIFQISVEKARKLLQYRPETTIAKGVEKLLKHMPETNPTRG